MPVSRVIDRWIKTGDPLVTTRHLQHEFCCQLLELTYHLEAQTMLRDNDIMDDAVIDEVTGDLNQILAWLQYWWDEGVRDEVPRSDFRHQFDRYLMVQPEMLNVTHLRQSMARYAASALPEELRDRVNRIEQGFYLRRPAERAMDMLIFQAGLMFVRLEFEHEFLDPKDGDFDITDPNMFVGGSALTSAGEAMRRDDKLVMVYRVHPILRPLLNAPGDEADVIELFRRLACNMDDEEHIRLYCNEEVDTLDSDDQGYFLDRITNLLGARIAGGLFTGRRP